MSKFGYIAEFACKRSVLQYGIFYHIIVPMEWAVRFHKKTAKNLKKLPKKIQNTLTELVNDIIASGPTRGDWPNYSKLADGSHHCHLNYSYVVVWVVVNNEIKIVEVTYVGSRENAPY